MTTPRVFPLVLAGGSGTRFWPLSRKSRPKQFLSLVDRPLVVETVARLEGLCARADLAVIAGEEHEAELRRLLPEVAILVEPAPRAVAADPDAALLVLPSDHAIGDPGAFRRALRQAIDLAAEGDLVTLGIPPTRPETGFGYIRVGEPLAGRPFAHRVRAFVEK